MTFALQTGADTTEKSGNTRTVTANLGSLADKDALFFWAGSRSTANTHTFTTPSGFTQLGSTLRTDYPSAPGHQRYSAVDLWWKRATGPESSLTATGSPGINGMRVGYDAFRSSTGETPAIVSPCQDDSTGSTASATYTPPSYTTTRTSLVLLFVWQHPDVNGTLAVTTAQGFTVLDFWNAFSGNPIGAVLGQVLTAGTHTMPTVGATGGLVRPWSSKTLALAAELPPPTGGWSVGSIRWG